MPLRNELLLSVFSVKLSFMHLENQCSKRSFTEVFTLAQEERFEKG